MTLRRSGADVDIGIDAPSNASLKVQLRGVRAVESVKGGGQLTVDPQGVILAIEGTSRSVQFRITGA